jgi:hypothetical protein
MPNLWKYDEKELRDDVKLNLPEGWKLRVFHVTSGDSGKKYWVQILRSSERSDFVISLCNCDQGYFQLPLSVLGLKICCKHAENVLAFLKERGH